MIRSHSGSPVEIVSGYTSDGGALLVGVACDLVMSAAVEAALKLDAVEHVFGERRCKIWSRSAKWAISPLVYAGVYATEMACDPTGYAMAFGVCRSIGDSTAAYERLDDDEDQINWGFGRSRFRTDVPDRRIWMPTKYS